MKKNFAVETGLTLSPGDKVTLTKDGKIVKYNGENLLGVVMCVHSYEIDVSKGNVFK